jgi:hypothetical protein
MTEHYYVRRFGVVAIEKGFITQDQLNEALKAQVEENVVKHEHRFVGSILLGLGYMTREEIIEVLETSETEKRIMGGEMKLRADLSGAKLCGAYLNRADFREAYLREADLRRARVRGANLAKTYLGGANLAKADLTEADFEEAKLRRANFRRANLTRARGLTLDQISKVKTLYQAKLDLELKEQIREEYPHLLENPKARQ